MWIVHGVESSYVEDKTARMFGNCFVYSRQLCISYGRHFVLYVKLRNTGTGRIVELCGRAGCWSVFENDLRNYAPYGWIKTGERIGLIVVIDELSWQFLGYVKSVSMIKAEEIDTSVFNKLIIRDIKVGFYDAGKTILNCGEGELHTVDGFPVTLFTALCLWTEGWFEDKFYLAGLDNRFYVIDFEDVRKARSFIAKALMSGAFHADYWHTEQPRVFPKGVG